MNKIISAEFENVDLAELAAKNIKNRFKGVTQIRIKHNSLHRDEPRYHTQDSISLDYTATAALYTQGFGGGVIPNIGYSAAFVPFLDFGANDSLPREVDYTHQSIIEITIAADQAKKVSSYLHSVGGIGVIIGGE